jgi:hypothetical protein
MGRLCLHFDICRVPGTNLPTDIKGQLCTGILPMDVDKQLFDQRVC